MTGYIILSTQYISNVLAENVILTFSALFIYLLQYYAFLAYHGKYLVPLFNSELYLDRIKVAIIIYFIPRKLGILCGPLADLINGETFSTTKYPHEHIVWSILCCCLNKKKCFSITKGYVSLVILSLPLTNLTANHKSYDKR